jgi:hypothetical protein
LDLTQLTGNQRSTPKDDFLDEVLKSPRIARPTSASAVFGGLALTLLPRTLKLILKRAKESKQAIRELKWKIMECKTATTFRVSF